jgi:general secretion pathway protein G
MGAVAAAASVTRERGSGLAAITWPRGSCGCRGETRGRTWYIPCQEASGSPKGLSGAEPAAVAMGGEEGGGTAAVRSKPHRRRGFTLIEALIVIVVIAILAAIVVPRLLGTARKSREATLRDTLHQLRNSINLFQAQTGAFPSQLSDIMRDAGNPPSHGVGPDGLTQVDIIAADWQGPYLLTRDGALPKDPMTGKADWDYTDSGTDVGSVHSASTATGLNGIPYSEW